jgi:cytochrome c biogenesis protein CcdA
MLRLIGVVISIGLADSLNPTTIAPALYLATGERARTEVTEFTLAVFGVYLVGGVAIALGPGQLLLSLVPSPDADSKHLIETIAGAALIVAAILLWRNRERLARQQMPGAQAGGRSGAILGATISAVELPTAFPYFAAIAAIVGSGLDVPRQLFLLVLFNVCFVLPLIGIVLTLTFAGDRAERMLAAGRNFLQRNWAVLLAALLFVAGLFVIVLGITGLASHGHGRVGRFMRGVRGFLHP